MLLGHYRHGVDAKGRVAVPAPFRRALPEGSVLSYGTEGRLVIRDPQAWEEVRSRYRYTAETHAEERSLLRTLYSSARTVELDAQGRLLLPEEHRRWASIAERAVFTGMGNCVEIVGEQVWDGEQSGLDPAAYTALNDRVIARAPSAAGLSQPA